MGDQTNRMERKLDRILALIKKEDILIMSTLTEVLADVAEEKTAIDSLVVLTNSLAEQVKAIPNLTPEQQAQIDAIFAAVEGNKAEVQAAIVANTPPTG